ncbi:MAG: TRAP transporter small permease [Bradyrhizobiaceae bacterium]|nr:TRAP transporter small permease [Bradyrhizobiaceae bacterium]
MRNAVDRFIDGIERTAAIFLAAVTVLVFLSIALRALFTYAIPDWYDLSRLMLGVMIFWGIAGASYHNRHIKVDILWEWAGPRARRWIDIAASLILLAFLLVFSWMLVEKVRSGYLSGESTFDLRMVIWPFHFVAALGIFSATALMVVRIVRLLRGMDDTEAMPSYE